MSTETDHWSSPEGCHPGCPACDEEEEIERRASFTKEDWQEDVRQGNTKLGFEEWVEHNVESERDRILEDIAAIHRLHAAAPALLAALRHVLSIYGTNWTENTRALVRDAIAMTEPPKNAEVSASGDENQKPK